MRLKFFAFLGILSAGCFSYLFGNESEDFKKFVIVIPSYNNEKFVEKNFFSAINQDYPNFEVVYINDASTDKTGELVDAFAKMYPRTKCTIIHNLKNQGALQNIYESVHRLEEEEIVCLLDGDDWFPHDQVLKKLNRYYQNGDVWITYGQYQSYPSGRIGLSKKIDPQVIKKKQLRLKPWSASHLRTFYAGLFKRILKEDLVHEGKFFDVAWDLAIMFPMLEMAEEHSLFISEVLYIYNERNPLSDYKIKRRNQVFFDRLIRKKQPYNN